MHECLLDWNPHTVGSGFEEARRVLRDADPNEPGLACVSHDNADVEAERLHVRKRCSGSQDDRSEERKHFALEPLCERPKLTRSAVLGRADPNPGGGERRPQFVAPEHVLGFLERDNRATRRGERLSGCSSVRSSAGDAGSRLILEFGHPHGKELVKVRRGDGAELDAVEERQRLVGGQLENATVEVDPGQLAVEKVPYPGGRHTVRAGRPDVSRLPRGEVEWHFVAHVRTQLLSTVGAPESSSGRGERVVNAA